MRRRNNFNYSHQCMRKGAEGFAVFRSSIIPSAPRMNERRFPLLFFKHTIEYLGRRLNQRRLSPDHSDESEGIDAQRSHLTRRESFISVILCSSQSCPAKGVTKRLKAENNGNQVLMPVVAARIEGTMNYNETIIAKTNRRRFPLHSSHRFVFYFTLVDSVLSMKLMYSARFFSSLSFIDRRRLYGFQNVQIRIKI